AGARRAPSRSGARARPRGGPVRVVTSAGTMPMAVVREALRARRRATPRQRGSAEAHLRRLEHPCRAPAVLGADRVAARLAHRARDLEREPAHLAAERIARHGGTLARGAATD